MVVTPQNRFCCSRPKCCSLRPLQSAALNAVVADASTHVIRGTTVSVQWSRGAKDGGDRPRRRNSSNSGSGSGNGGSPPRNGRSSSSSKNGMFPPKGHRGGGGGGSCGGGCSRGFSPLRNRSQSHVHPAGSGAGGMPFAYCGGGHGGDHLNQAMVREGKVQSKHDFC